MDVFGRVVVLTGASRGLGLETARVLARRGAGLVLTARGSDALGEAAAELGRYTDVVALPGDVADRTHAANLFGVAMARFGRIDVLINNASTIGASPMPALEAYPPELLEQVFRINVVAPLHLTQLVLPQMKARGEGVIVNITSDAAVNAYPGWGGYGVTKAALEHLSRILAAELEGTGVRVYAVDPGDMDTRMHRDAEPGVDLSHLPKPDTVAPAVVRLIESETAPFGRFEAQKLLVGT